MTYMTSPYRRIIICSAERAADLYSHASASRVIRSTRNANEYVLEARDTGERRYIDNLVKLFNQDDE